MSKSGSRKKIPEIPLIGDIDDWEEDVFKAVLDLPQEGECLFYFDSPGGSVYGALTITSLIQQRRIRTTGIVLGECSSAAVLIFAACRKRLVTRFSTFLLHRMRWQSDKRVGAQEAALWARHFEDLEKEIDDLQEKLFGTGAEQLRQWIASSHYVTGSQMVAAGLAQLLEM